MLYKVDYLIIAEELQLVDLKAVALKQDYPVSASPSHLIKHTTWEGADVR